MLKNKTHLRLSPADSVLLSHRLFQTLLCAKQFSAGDGQHIYIRESTERSSHFSKNSASVLSLLLKLASVPMGEILRELIARSMSLTQPMLSITTKCKSRSEIPHLRVNARAGGDA
jgi:hypothetical protein